MKRTRFGFVLQLLEFTKANIVAYSLLAKRITFGAVDVWRIADGKIVEAWAVDGLFDR